MNQQEKFDELQGEWNQALAQSPYFPSNPGLAFELWVLKKLAELSLIVDELRE